MNWYKRNEMVANPDKVQLIFFGLKEDHDLSIDIRGNVIKMSETVKLLGVTIDSKLNFNGHIKTILTGWNTLVFKFGLIQDISWGLKWPNMPLCIPSRVSWDQETYLSSNSHSFCPFKQQDAYLRFFERNHR